MTTGAGSFPAGTSPAGAYIPTTTAGQIVAKPTTSFFDPSTMTAPVNADTSIQSAHPVDVQVILALSIEVGQIASVPTQGHTLGELGRMAPEQLPAAATDRVQLALAGPLGRGDIELLGVDVAVLPYGNNQYAVRYANLRLPKSPPRTVTRTQ